MSFSHTSHRRSLGPARPLLFGVTKGRALSYEAASRAAGPSGAQRKSREKEEDEMRQSDRQRLSGGPSRACPVGQRRQGHAATWEVCRGGAASRPGRLRGREALVPPGPEDCQKSLQQTQTKF